jgi:hypothetical protein
MGKGAWREIAELGIAAQLPWKAPGLRTAAVRSVDNTFQTFIPICVAI